MPLSYLFAFVASAAMCALATPAMRSLSFRIGALSQPGGRNVHNRRTARLGGLAIFAGFVVPLVTIALMSATVSRAIQAEWRRSVGFIIGAVVVVAIGAIDDTRPQRATTKLLLQIVAALVAFYFGFTIDAVSLPHFGTIYFGVFALPFTLIWIVGIVNAMNLIDGLDGLAGGIAFFAAITNFTVAFVSGSQFVAVLMAALAGAMLGFLFHNLNPARIFMGDSGSYFIGFTLATVSVAAPFQRAAATVSLLVPIIALGVPITDTLFAMVRRVIERRPIFSPDRGHLHHRLIDLGITQRRAVLIIYGISVVLAAGAIAISIGKDWRVGFAILGASLVAFGAMQWVRSAQHLARARLAAEPVRGERAEALRRQIVVLAEQLSRRPGAEETWQALKRLATASDLARVEWRHGEVFVFPEGAQTVPSESSTDRVHARFRLGPNESAGHEIVFDWEGTSDRQDLHVGVLLQVVADLVDRSVS